jgi:hypothetical protein
MLPLAAGGHPYSKYIKSIAAAGVLASRMGIRWLAIAVASGYGDQRIADAFGYGDRRIAAAFGYGD